jgi:hypothetical protein
MSGHTVGGADVFAAEGRERNMIVYGDAGGDMSAFARGGNDVFTINEWLGDATFYGDAGGDMSGHARGGADTLVGGDNVGAAQAAGAYESFFVGDAQTMSGAAHGGNDRLVSGTGNDEMWGDAQTLLGHAQGGNDTFVFGPNNGQDAIEDFGQGLKGTNWGTDHIDVSGLGIQNFSQLDISAFDSTSRTSTITFSAGDDVTVHSLVALSAQDFKFA